MSIENIKSEAFNLKYYINKTVYIVNDTCLKYFEKEPILTRVIEGFNITKGAVHLITDYGNYNIDEYNIFFSKEEAQAYIKSNNIKESLV